MPRIIGEDVKNELVLKDQFSRGHLITLYFRFPTSEERIAYESMKYHREKDKVTVRLTEARQTWGAKIITGFKDGSFAFKESGQIKNISSDSASPDYASTWLDLVKKYASDTLEELAAHVFDGLSVISIQEEEFTEKNS